MAAVHPVVLTHPVIYCLRKLGACTPAIDFAHDDPEHAWSQCDRPEWLVWLVITLQTR